VRVVVEPDADALHTDDGRRRFGDRLKARCPIGYVATDALSQANERSPGMRRVRFRVACSKASPKRFDHGGPIVADEVRFLKRSMETNE